MPPIVAEPIPPIVRKRVREVAEQEARQERAVRAQLRPRTGAISISQRRLLAGAVGLSAEWSKGDSE